VVSRKKGTQPSLSASVPIPLGWRSADGEERGDEVEVSSRPGFPDTADGKDHGKKSVALRSLGHS